jgi:hypothetical protein
MILDCSALHIKSYVDIVCNIAKVYESHARQREVSRLFGATKSNALVHQARLDIVGEPKHVVVAS